MPPSLVFATPVVSKRRNATGSEYSLFCVNELSAGQNTQRGFWPFVFLIEHKVWDHVLGKYFGNENGFPGLHKDSRGEQKWQWLK